MLISQASLMKFFSLISITVTVAILGCGPRITEKPAAFFSVNEHHFQSRAGVMYMDNEVFTGTQLFFHPGYDTAAIIPYRDGREQGIAVYKYPGGKVKEIRSFSKGRKTGVHKGWWPSGKPRFVYAFSNDVYNGDVKDWYESGQLFRDFHYTKGVEDGLQKQYFDNGVLQFNYEARNGRQYGLTGIKKCINAKDSTNRH